MDRIEATLGKMMNLLQQNRTMLFENRAIMSNHSDMLQRLVQMGEAAQGMTTSNPDHKSCQNNQRECGALPQVGRPRLLNRRGPRVVNPPPSRYRPAKAASARCLFLASTHPHLDKVRLNDNINNNNTEQQHRATTTTSNIMGLKRN